MQMTAVIKSLTDAPTTEDIDWHSIPWNKVNSEAKRLQMRIAKAAKNCWVTFVAFLGLEPCAVKVASTVLRGGAASNSGSLLGVRQAWREVPNWRTIAKLPE